MTILFEDAFYLIIDKPSGIFVHPPPESKYKIEPSKILTHILKKTYGEKYFPIHRLDYGTSGLLLLAKQQDYVSYGAELFRLQKIEKSYLSVVRGFVEPTGIIEIPLEVDFGRSLSEAKTSFQSLAQIELPVAISKRYPTSRYSLVRAIPHTGKWHQIRRHFDRIAHPIIGDVEHGDSHHNRFYRDQLKIEGLCLRAHSLRFTHPITGSLIDLKAPPTPQWKKIADLFNYPIQNL